MTRNNEFFVSPLFNKYYQNELPTSKTWLFHLNLRPNALLSRTTHGPLTNPLFQDSIPQTSGQTRAQAHSILTHRIRIICSIPLLTLLRLSFPQLERVPQVLSSLTQTLRTLQRTLRRTLQRTPQTTRLSYLPILKHHPIGLRVLWALQRQHLHKTSCCLLSSLLPLRVVRNENDQTEDAVS